MIVIINLVIMWAFCYFGWLGIKWKFRQWRRARQERRLQRAQRRAARKRRPQQELLIDGGVLYPESHTLTPARILSR